MKKILLIIAVVGFAFAVNAQTVTKNDNNVTKGSCCQKGKMTNGVCKDAKTNKSDSTSCCKNTKGTKCSGTCKDSKGVKCSGTCKNGQVCKGNGKSCTGSCKKDKTIKKE